MRQAVHIFLKDSRQFRWPILLLLAWMSLLAVVGGQRFDPGLLGQGLVGENIVRLSLYLVPLAWWVLIALVVQAESLVGDRQFWLTRPYDRASLFVAKALFVLAYIVLPMTIAQAAMAVQRGLPLDPTVPGLIWNQVLIGLVFVLPATAIASLTGTFTRFVFFSFAVVPVFIAAELLPPWNGVEWVRTTIALVMLGLTVGGVLWLQYRLRREGWSRLLALSATLAALVILHLLPWRVGFAVQARMLEPSSGKVAAELIEVDYPAPGNYSAAGTPFRPLSIGFRLSGIPEDQAIVCEGTRMSFTVRNGPTWSARASGSSFQRTGGEGCWFNMQAPVALFDMAAGPTSTIHADLFMTLFEPSRVTTVAVGEALTEVEGLGVCGSTTPAFPPTVDEQSRFARFYCEIGFRAPRVLIDVSGRRLMPPSYSPFPADLTFPSVLSRSWTVRPVDNVTLATQRPVAHLRLTTEARNVDLAKF
jgi:hypothetical protein